MNGCSCSRAILCANCQHAVVFAHFHRSRAQSLRSEARPGNHGGLQVWLVGSFASGGIGVGAIVDGGSMHPRWDPARGTLALRQIANIPVSHPRARPQGPADLTNASLRLRQTCRREEYACTLEDVESTFVTSPLLASLEAKAAHVGCRGRLALQPIPRDGLTKPTLMIWSTSTLSQVSSNLPMTGGIKLDPQIHASAIHSFGRISTLANALQNNQTPRAAVLKTTGISHQRPSSCPHFCP